MGVHAALFTTARERGHQLGQVYDLLTAAREAHPDDPWPDEAEALAAAIWRFRKQYDMQWRVDDSRGFEDLTERARVRPAGQEGGEHHP